MKNKVWLTLCMILLCTAGILIVNRDTSQADQTGVVTASGGLNVRTGAGTNYEIMKSGDSNVVLAGGTAVTILETLDGWYKVSFVFQEETLTGYVSAQYVAVETTATATPQASSTPAPTAKVTYRNVTTYKKIAVKADTAAKTAVYKNVKGKLLKTAGKTVTIKRGKAVTITKEKTNGDQKWFRVTFRYKGKEQSGFLPNTKVVIRPDQTVTAEIFNVKASVKIRKQAGTNKPYKKVKGTVVKLQKKTAVAILKEKTAASAKWYQISFTYKGQKQTGYLHSRYVRLIKEKVVKKVAVTAMTDAQFEKSMTEEGFPDSYKESLRTLHKSYPYWQFQSYKTGLDWTEALEAESVVGKNLISISKSKAWKSTEEGAYDATSGEWKIFDGSTWVAASKEAVAYYMDPRNFLNERSIYQFESLEYQPQYQTEEGVNVILSNTPFYDKTFSYTDPDTEEEKNISYTGAFLKAAEISGVSPYHLASRVKQEVVTGATTTSIAVTGENSTYPGIFNFYNIGAVSSTNPALKGLAWASKGTTYLRPWTDRYRSIVGGAQYIGTSYINKGQNTGYLQKFNMTANQRYEHQYMTNVEAAYAEAIKTKKAYEDKMDKAPIVFSIPVYENMPESNCSAPK